MTDNQALDEFLRRDLLVSLGAMELALKWLGDGSEAPQSLPPALLRNLSSEISGLRERAQSACGALPRAAKFPAAEASPVPPPASEASVTEHLQAQPTMPAEDCLEPADTLQDPESDASPRPRAGLPPDVLDLDALPPLGDDELDESIDELLATALAARVGTPGETAAE